MNSTNVKTVSLGAHLCRIQNNSRPWPITARNIPVTFGTPSWVNYCHLPFWVKPGGMPTVASRPLGNCSCSRLGLYTVENKWLSATGYGTCVSNILNTIRFLFPGWKVNPEARRSKNHKHLPTCRPCILAIQGMNHSACFDIKVPDGLSCFRNACVYVVNCCLRWGCIGLGQCTLWRLGWRACLTYFMHRAIACPFVKTQLINFELHTAWAQHQGC